jgi:hypothetical protein
MKAKIRKISTFVEETQREMDREISPSTRKAAAVAVIENPCAGKYVEDLSELMAIGEVLGELSRRWAFRATRQRATARPQPWEKTGNWNTRRQSCIRNSERPSAGFSAKVRP